MSWLLCPEEVCTFLPWFLVMLLALKFIPSNCNGVVFLWAITCKSYLDSLFQTHRQYYPCLEGYGYLDIDVSLPGADGSHTCVSVLFLALKWIYFMFILGGLFYYAYHLNLTGTHFQYLKDFILFCLFVYNWAIIFSSMVACWWWGILSKSFSLILF